MLYKPTFIFHNLDIFSAWEETLSIEKTLLINFESQGIDLTASNIAAKKASLEISNTQELYGAVKCNLASDISDYSQVEEITSFVKKRPSDSNNYVWKAFNAKRED